MLVALTYLETFLSNDEEHREFLIENTPPEELVDGLTSLTLISFQWSASSSNTSIADIIKIAREVAIAKTSEELP